MKNNLHIFGLLGVGAIALLIYLMLRNHGGSTAVQAVPTASANGNYPNSQPINMGNIEVGGSPLNITYNQQPIPPDVNIGTAAESCGADCCSDVQTLTSVQNVTPALLESSKTNLLSFVKKGAAFTSAPAAPVNSDGGAVNY